MKVNTKTHCRYCGGELTLDEKRGCKICLACHPPDRAPPAPPAAKPVLLDVKHTEEQIREIVRDELENWHIRKPPVTASEVESLVGSSSNTTPTIVTGQGWRKQAKALGIPLNQKTGGARKKDDVLKDIEARTSGLSNVPADGDNNEQ